MTPRAAWTLRLLFVAIGPWTAAIGPFISVILRGRGFDPAAIGLVTAGAAIAVIVIVPVWGHVADVLVGRTRAFRIGLVVAGIAAIALLLPLPAVAIVISLASFAVFIGVFNALGDALAVDALTLPERQYGALRSLSSFSFAVAVVAVGFLYNWAGYGAASIVVLAWSVVLFVLVGPVTDRTHDRAFRLQLGSQPGAAANGRMGSVGRAFAAQPRLLGVLAAFTLAWAGIQGGVTFVSIRIVELGGHPSDVALTFGISALFEVPGLVLAGWLGRRIGLRALTAASLIGFGLCMASWAELPTPDAINATRLLTGLCYGTFTAARVLLIARLLPPALQATGQGLVQAATIGIGTVAGTALGGIAYGLLGPAGYFLGAAAAAIVGGAWAWLVLGGTLGARDRPEVA
ncbi:MAG TPA: MFS transporter [Candidatus Limnocylindrales bacterium]|nr:MFS transporter [Candidatus Limnocylindrales bacterium]